MGHYECKTCGNYLGHGHEEWCPDHFNKYDLEMKKLREQRRDEIDAKVGELIRKYKPSIEDTWDSENPEHKIKMDRLKQKSDMYKEIAREKR